MLERMNQAALALLTCALLTACGGGDGPDPSVDASLTTDGTAVTGAFATCAPVGTPIAFASMQTRLDITDTTLQVSVRHHLGTRCSGPALVTLKFPAVSLTADGTQPVPGATPGTTVLALKVTQHRGAGVVTWEGDGNYVRLRNNQLQVIVPDTDIVLYGQDVSVPASTRKDLLAFVANRMYEGNTLYDAQGYPTGLDFSSGRDRL